MIKRYRWKHRITHNRIGRSWFLTNLWQICIYNYESIQIIQSRRIFSLRLHFLIFGRKNMILYKWFYETTYLFSNLTYPFYIHLQKLVDIGEYQRIVPSILNQNYCYQLHKFSNYILLSLSPFYPLSTQDGKDRKERGSSWRLIVHGNGRRWKRVAVASGRTLARTNK